MVVVAMLLVATARSSDRQDYVPQYPEDIRVETDVAYLPSDRSEKLDIYHPVGVPEGRRVPAVVYFHGGGFNDGDKARPREISICSDLARQGYLAVSATYKLRRGPGQVTWPRNIQDCKLAVRWVRDNADRLGVDPERIAVMGGSAGGTIAALLGYTDPSDGLEPPEAGSSPAPKISAVVNLYGVMDLLTYRDMKMFGKTRAEAPELYREASPLTYLDAGDPPTFVAHGTADETVSLEQSEKLVARLKELGVPHVYIAVEGAPHTFNLHPPQMDLKPALFSFLREHLGEPGRAVE